jgi:hypothetical protein
MKGIQNPLEQNHKTLKKEIEEETRRWKDLTYSWIGRINIAILLKAIHRLNAIPIKIPMPFFAEIKKINPRIHMEA